MRKILMFSLLFFVCLSLASAVWWNPWTWDDNTAEHKGSWYTEYSSDTDYFIWFENSSKKKTEVCLLHKTATGLNELDEHKNLYDENRNVIESLNRKKKTLEKDYYGFCRNIDSDLINYIKFGEHSTVIMYNDESIDIKDSSGDLILKTQLTTHDFTYKNDKPHKDLGLGKQITHSFKLTAHDNLTNVLNEIKIIDQKTGLEVDIPFKILIRYLENVEILTYDINCTTLVNGTEVCNNYVNGSYITTKYAYMDAAILNNTIDLSDGEEIDFAISIDIKQGMYFDIAPVITGINLEDYFATISGDVATNLISYWSLDDLSGDAIDAHASNDGTVTGATQGVIGKIETAYSFLDSDVDYVSIANEANFDFEKTDAFSISFWFKSADTGNNRIIAKQANSVDFEGYAVHLNSNGEIQFALTSSSSDRLQIDTTSSSFNDGNWHLIVATYSGNETINGLNIFIDGNDVAVSDGSIGTLGSILNNVNLRIGSRDGGGVPFNGTIDEVGIWSRELTVTEATVTIWGSGDGIPYEEADLPPTVTLDSPANGTVYNTNSISIDFKCKGIDDINLDNLTFTLYNETDDAVVFTSTNTDGQNDTLETFTRVVTGGTNYSWNCLAIDNSSNEAWATNNFTIDVISIPDNAPNVTLNSPANDTTYLTSPQSITFNCTVSDDVKIDNVSLIINSVINLTNSSGANASNYLFTPSAFNDGSYTWSCLTTDNSSQQAQPTSRTFLVDANNPSVTITAPANGTIITEFNQSFNLNWTITDANLDTCWWQEGPLEFSSCYQESANVTNQTGVDGDCRLSYTGDYFYTGSPGVPNNGVDGSFVTAVGVGTYTYQVNYTKPQNSQQGSIITGRYGVGGERNHTIPSSCWNAFSNKIVIRISTDGSQISLSCMMANGNFNNIITIVGSPNLFEEAIIWNSTQSKTQNIVTCNDNTTSLNYPVSNPDSYTISLLSNDTVGNVGSDSVTVVKSTDTPNITITSPIDFFGTLESGETLDVNFSVTDNVTTLHTCTLSYNSINTTINCTENTTLSYVSGVNELTIFANDTLGNVGSQSKTWTVVISGLSFNFTESVLETANDTFTINVTVISGLSVQSADLIYNGTRFTGSQTTNPPGGETRFELSIIVPLGQPGFAVENRTFFWNLTIVNETTGVTFGVESSEDNQTVAELFFDICGGPLNVSMLNFTMFNEIDQTQINAAQNATTFQATFLFGASLNGQLKNTTIDNQSVNVSEFDFCTDNENNTIIIDMQAFYTASGFSDKKYFIEDGTLTNDTNQISLFLLPSILSIEFLHTVELNLFSLENAIVQVQKFFVGEGVYKTVEIQKSDDDGKFISFLELNKDYQYIVISDGEVLISDNKTAICGVAPCELTIQIGTTEFNILSGLEGFADDVVYSIDYNQNTGIVTFNFVDTTGLATSFRMTITSISFNQTGIVVSDQQLFTSSGTMTYNMTGETAGDYRIEVSISRSPFIIIDYLDFIKDDIAGQFGLLGLLFAFFTLLTIIFGVALKPSLLIMSVPMSLFTIKFMGVFSMGYTSLTAISILALISYFALEK